MGFLSWSAVTLTADPVRAQSALPASAGVHGEPGAAVFHAHCARCHGETGADGMALGRALKASPLENDPRFATMPTGDLMRLIRSVPKHHDVFHLRDADLKAAALFVKHLARQPDRLAPSDAPKRPAE